MKSKPPRWVRKVGWWIEYSLRHQFWKLIVAAAAAVIGLWCLGWIPNLVLEHAADIGDSFGVANSLFSALAFAGLVVAVLLQTRELRLQRKDLALQREELRATREELSRSAEAQDKSQRALIAQTDIMLQSAFLAAADALCRSYSDEITNPQTTSIRAAGLRDNQVASRQRLEAMLSDLDKRFPSTPVAVTLNRADEGLQVDRRGLALRTAQLCSRMNVAIQRVTGHGATKDLHGLKASIELFLREIDQIASEGHAFVPDLHGWYGITVGCKTLHECLALLASQPAFDVHEREKVSRELRSAGASLAHTGQQLVKVNEQAEKNAARAEEYRRRAIEQKAKREQASEATEET